MNRHTTCLLCGISSNDVSVGLIAWTEPVGSSRYTAAPRCRDARACRERVEALGEHWEVRIPDTTTRELIEQTQ